jgi:signal transduction histidine kinase
MTWFGRATAPLRGVATLLVGIYLVLGGVVAGAYAVLVVGFWQMFTAQALVRPALVVLAAVAAAIALAPPFLGAVRTLEILAARTFLGVDLPVPDGAGPPPSPATRWRAAAWYGLHLTLGAAGTVALLFVAPTVTQLVLDAGGADPGLAGGLLPDVDGPGGAVLSLLAGVLLVVALPYGAWGARVLLRQAAWPLLGPDQSERIAELETVARRSAERGRLARELHDSVGHALTITTLQAAVASRSLDADPDAARRALAAIEETGRAAMADLDHVLGLLRDPGSTGSTSPLRTLADVPRLVDDARGAGGDVILSWGSSGSWGLSGSAGEGGDGAEAFDAVVPRATSREAYRLVQEALTNALRHAPGERVTVRLALEGPALVVEVSNGLRASVASASVAPANGTRRGLTGMAERVRLVGGTFEAGPVDGSPSGVPGSAWWVVRARFGLNAGGAGARGPGTAGSGA